MVIAVLLYAVNGMCSALVIIFSLSRRPFNHIHSAIIYTLMLYLLFSVVVVAVFFFLSSGGQIDVANNYCQCMSERIHCTLALNLTLSLLFCSASPLLIFCFFSFFKGHKHFSVSGSIFQAAHHIGLSCLALPLVHATI